MTARAGSNTVLVGFNTTDAAVDTGSGILAFGRYTRIDMDPTPYYPNFKTLSAISVSCTGQASAIRHDGTAP